MFHCFVQGDNYDNIFKVEIENNDPVNNLKELIEREKPRQISVMIQGIFFFAIIAKINDIIFLHVSYRCSKI
jgi:hypothetical protein